MNDNKNTNDGAGGSMFAGEHSVFVQNNEQQDDEEELEDQKRRQEELQNLIANAFDEFEYEDENSRVNSSFESTNSSKYRTNTSNIQGSGDNFTFTDKNYKNTSLNGVEQLQVLYQIRVQEAQKLTKEMDALKEQFKADKDQMCRKMLLLEADNNRINITLTQSQHLLVEKAEMIEKQSKEIEKLKEFVENLQSSNEKFEEEVLFWKSNSNEIEQKLHLMEKGLNKNISEKQIRGHYEQEISKLQEILQLTNTKLEKTEQQVHDLQNHIQEVEHDKEVALGEKARVINTITKNLEDSQAQSFSLMNKLTSLQQDKTTLENELFSKSTKQDTTVKRNSTNQNYEEIIVTLRDELRRCLEEQNKKRQEINQLEKLVETLKQNETKLHQVLINKQSKDEENGQLKQENNKMSQEILNLQQKIKELQDQINKKSDGNISMNSSRSSTSSERNREKREEYKKLKEELCKVEKQIHESLNLKDRYINCEQQCLTLQELVADLNSKLSESQLTITTLKEKLALTAERDNLIESLKKKAEMFEEYMANKPEPVTTQNTSMNTSNCLTEKNNCATQTDEATDQQMNVYMKQLIELERILDNQTKQMRMLYEENKALKEKIVFDRKSLNELSSIWSQEMKKINQSLELTKGQNEELIKNIDVLKKENTQKQLLCDILNSKIEQAKEYINLMEVTSTRHNKHVTVEHEQVKAKFQGLLGIIEARLTRCIDVTKSNVY